MDNNTPLNVTTMPTLNTLERFRGVPADFAYIAFDVSGTMHLVVPEKIKNGDHIGLRTARAVFSLCANPAVGKIIHEAVEQQKPSPAVGGEAGVAEPVTEPA